MTKKGLLDNYKKLLLLSIFSGIVILIAIVGFSMSWFTTQRELDMMTMIKTPIVLKLRTGNDHDIVYLDMGNIDVESGEDRKSYVFCVYGEPIDYYSLQLAHTTNIDFKYSIYRADYFPDINDSNATDDYVKSVYLDENKNECHEYFKISQEHVDPVIETKLYAELTNDDKKVYQNHDLSYDNLQSGVEGSYDNVQKNAEPLYWLAEENGLKSIKPINTTENNQFYDYYILTVSWDKNTVVNNKETDMIYISVSF